MISSVKVVEVTFVYERRDAIMLFLIQSLVCIQRQNDVVIVALQILDKLGEISDESLSYVWLFFSL